MLGRGNGHEGVRRKSRGVDAWLQLPLSPAVVVLGRGQPERRKRLRPLEEFVPPFARKKTRQNGVVRLTNQNELVALLLKDHRDFPRLQPHKSHSTARWGGLHFGGGVTEVVS